MKMEIELTESQAEKVEILKEKGLSVGEAIEILFDMKETISERHDLFVENKINEANQQKAELEKKLTEVENEISLFSKIKNSSLNPVEKQKILEKEYLKTIKPYDESITEHKHKFKWHEDLFKL